MNISALDYQVFILAISYGYNTGDKNVIMAPKF